jgi:hypothetical protein
MNDEIRSSEKWRPVTDFEDHYAVSMDGEVYSFRLGRRLKQCLNTSGYPRVILKADGRSVTRTVHRLVAEAFHGDKRNALHREVDHIDRDRTNARADNLRWVSKGENMARRLWSPGNTKLTASVADKIRAEKGRRRAKAVAAEYGIKPHTVYDIWNGRSFAPSPIYVGLGYSASVTARGALQ